MTWSRLLGIMVLVLRVNAASIVGIVLSFALVMRYLGSLTVWNEIFPWATDTLDMMTRVIRTFPSPLSLHLLPWR
jgi:hypothetical protein